MIIYNDVFEKLNSNENDEQTITEFLGPNWLEKTAKIQRNWNRIIRINF